MYLLDTNHCSRIIQADATILRQVAARRANELATCVIVQGELLCMARNSDRPTEYTLAVRAFFDEIDIYTIDADTADDFARIKAAILRRWGPREKANRRHASVGQLGFADNDL